MPDHQTIDLDFHAVKVGCLKYANSLACLMTRLRGLIVAQLRILVSPQAAGRPTL